MIHIRGARRDDAEALTEIGLRAWKVALAPIARTDVLLDSARSAFGNFTASSWVSITLVEWNGAIAGWAAREALDEELTDFWIDPACQRRGAGAALLAEVERSVAAQGFDELRLKTHARNAPATAFFRAQGYSVRWLTVSYAPILDRDVEAIGMAKQLVEKPSEDYSSFIGP
ncbi:GNAT family N-acetyltransferase [Rhizobiaceae bacterium n13]|uniref:GNAT family N-acetyltransferase n=1 Tax=Ferirhizobium litorale TaxID=2927786 RepID=A0AAE3QIW5_9HYPH|nr:GNAT family N-acetyltransferase [Fererhizobium litorale]MDI7864403.1 GNAT family N-acetyltransferase [Fererhizobium litorale]MDI7924683.1 GNAT family N-acetyltransferase [Fererhizobium litorale]